jgi:hypothetical protein
MWSVAKLLCASLGLLMLSCQPASVRVLNDTPQLVRLFECQFLDPVELSPGATRTLRPTGACSVSAAGEYMGCLMIPTEAYSGSVVNVSRLVAGVPQADCARIGVRETR